MARVCGRYAASRNPDELVEVFEVERVDPSAEAGNAPGPDWNVAPTKPVLAVLTRAAGEGGGPVRQLRTLRWGLVPSWAKDPKVSSRMINARLETAPVKPAFRRAFAKRRCLLPADGYYEWYAPTPGPDAAPGKQPFFIHAADGSCLALAGLYEFWRDPAAEDSQDPASWLTTCTILTTAAPDDTGRIHDRAPLLVEPAGWERWLDPGVSEAARVADLLVPAAPGRLAAYPVSTRVNSVRNNGPSLLEPLPPEEESVRP